MASIVLLCALSCKDTTKQSSHKVKPSEPTPETFQELGFFGPVQQDKWEHFVRAVQNNIAHSRKEPENLSFSLYQPEDGTLQPIWFERFKTKEAHNLHKQQGYFKNAITVIRQSLAREAQSIELKELKEVPAITTKHSYLQKTSYSVITLFDIRPENQQAFITAMAHITYKYRAMAGNLEYNLYQYKDEPGKFVLIEGWESKTHYNTGVKRQIKQPDGNWFATEPIHMAVKDLSE